MLQTRVRIPNQLGLHARAAARLVRMASQFNSEIILRRADTGVEASAKSILNLLYLAAGFDITVDITVAGEDESEALAEIEKLFMEGFGEL